MDSISDRSVKCAHDDFEGDGPLVIEECTVPRVVVEDECAALHEMVTKQQLTIQNLMSELEEERNAAASAANEAMSMILRLQRDKAEVQMEARQFKQLAEEKMSHNQHETSVLEGMLYKRDQKILSLSCEVQSYRQRMFTYGVCDADGGAGMNRSASLNDFSQGLIDYPAYEIYPSLRCFSDGSPSHLNGDHLHSDMEKFAFSENAHSLEQLKDLESRIHELENNPTPAYPAGELPNPKSTLGNVVVGHSPGKLKPLRKLSLDSMSSPYAVNKEVCSDFFLNSSVKKMEFSDIEESFDLDKMDDTSELEDDMADRIYTVDSVFHGPSVASPRASFIFPDPRDLEIQKLYARVHALEADRESMRQEIISVSSNKAQMVLLKEIAQNLCKEMSPSKRIAERRQPGSMTFSLKSIFKWLVSSICFWRKKTHRCRYMFEESAYNLLGLLILLEKGHGRSSHEWKFILKTHLLNRPLRITV